MQVLKCQWQGKRVVKILLLKSAGLFPEDGAMESRVCHKERQNEIVVCLAVRAGM